MTSFNYIYIALWTTACVIAIVLMALDKKTLLLFQGKYWRYLNTRWKLLTFIIATSSFVVLAPYTGDPTWDYYDAGFMSVLTFMTAPWTVGTLYRAINKREKVTAAYIAICLWLFSASWSYDIYLVLRDGYYPITWFSNLFASSVLYISAGLFWNLEYREGRGVIFGFMENDWPAAHTRQKFNRILLYAIPFMILAAAIFIPFFI